MKSRLVFSEKLPELPFSDCLLVFDRRLRKPHGAWIRRFPRAYGVRSGEQLKDLGRFPSHAEKLLDLAAGVSPRRLTVVAFGGGSVGDFAGFFASVLKRGVKLVQVPSTWLAALDSAHGGKTALNAGGYKNQIGTFHPAETVHLCREVLSKLGERRFREARPEAVKAALLDGEPLTRALRAVETGDDLWRVLPRLIRAKMKIVEKDPRETKGLRHLLNLGHTVGHVLESETGAAHGEAVGLGLRFALEWSSELGLLRDPENYADFPGLPSAEELRDALRGVRDFGKGLLQDKKIGRSGKIRFIFLKRPGYPEIREVPVKEILREIRRQRR